MASVRVGMAFSSPAIVSYFNKMKPPYNISTINQKSVLKKMKNQATAIDKVNIIIAERERISAELKKIPVIRNVFRSDANFILVKSSNAGYIYNYLVSCGIIVRNRSSIVGNSLRITIGTRSENNKMLKALKSIRL
jgi:histidinol-phosphate aminotransferase